jgi:hypothetical protein
LLILTFIVLFCFCIPLHVSFEKSFISLVSAPVYLFAVALFWIDIIVTLNTGFYDKGVLILERRYILMSWLNNSFLFDMLALIPLSGTVLEEMQWAAWSV